jgi:hypothetical protein
LASTCTFFVAMCVSRERAGDYSSDKSVNET